MAHCGHGTVSIVKFFDYEQRIKKKNLALKFIGKKSKFFFSFEKILYSQNF